MTLDADMKVIALDLKHAASHLTMDFSNSYLYYVNPADNSLYRLNYRTLDSKTVPQKLYTITSSDVSNSLAFSVCHTNTFSLR